MTVEAAPEVATAAAPVDAPAAPAADAAKEGGAGAPSAEPTTAPDLSTQFSELARKEKELRKREKAIPEQVEKARSEWAASVRKDPLAALAELGITSQALTHALLGVQPDPEAPAEPASAVPKELLDEVKSLREWKAQKDREEKDKHVSDYRNKVFGLVESAADDYELLLNHPTGKDLYWGAVNAFVREEGELPSEADLKVMAQDVEKRLYDESAKLLKLKKLSAQPAPEKSEKAPAAVAAADKAAAPRTLGEAMKGRVVASTVKMEPVSGGYTRDMRSAAPQDRDVSTSVRSAGPSDAIKRFLAAQGN